MPESKLKTPKSFKAGLMAAAAGGLLQSLSYPPASLWPLAFLCLVPLWWAILDRPIKQALFFGWIYGLTLGLSSFCWLSSVMAGYGGLGTLGGLFILLLLASFLALYQAFWAWLISAIKKDTPYFSLWHPILGGFFWVGLDWLKNWVLTGFNWTPLAQGLAVSPTLVGAADLIGIYGLGLPLVIISYFLAQLLNFKLYPKACSLGLFTAILIFGAMAFYGQLSYEKWETARKESQVKNVAVIQASVEQDRKWDYRYRDQILARYETLAINAGQKNPFLIIWPETAAPFIYEVNAIETDWLHNLLLKVPFPMLVGLAAGDYDENGVFHLHNRAWFMEKDQKRAFYDKKHLVPFGEYIPLAEELPFLQYPFLQGILGAAGTYSPGKSHPPIYISGFSLGLLICFESIFPDLGRERLKEGADFLVVTTNDSWFGNSGAPFQHLYHAVSRAVENRRPLIRAGNNGISALISPSGLIMEQSALNDVGSYIYPLPLLNSKDVTQTFFVKYGFFLAPFSAVLTLLAFFWVVWSTKKKSALKK